MFTSFLKVQEAIKTAKTEAQNHNYGKAVNALADIQVELGFPDDAAKLRTVVAGFNGGDKSDAAQAAFQLLTDGITAAFAYRQLLGATAGVDEADECCRQLEHCCKCCDALTPKTGAAPGEKTDLSPAAIDAIVMLVTQLFGAIIKRRFGVA